MDSSAERRYVINYSDFIHTISIGAFSHKKCANKWWKLWSLYNIIAATTILIADLSYLITGDLILKKLAYLSVSIFTPIITLTIQKIGHQFSENWNNLKKILSRDFVGSLDVSGELRHNERVKNLKPLFKQTFIWIFGIHVTFCIISVLGGFLWQCFRQNVDFHHEFNYLIPFHGIHRVNDRQTFIFVYLVQSISCLSPVLTMSAMWLFIVVLAVEMSNMTTALEERMKSISQEVHRTVALIREYKTKTDTKKSPLLMQLVEQKSQNDRKICFQKFEENLKTCIRHHQTILRAVKLFRPFLNRYFTVNLAFLVIIMIATGFSITSGKGVTFNSYVIQILLGFSCALFHIGFQCLIAQRFQDMNDRIAAQVYSLPWYELTPPFRKNVYIFLCQAQAPIKFYAFNTFRFTTFFFPTIVNFVYTYIVNLLTIHNKYHPE